MTEQDNNKNILVIKRPRITEKSASLAESLGYTFDVNIKASKQEIRDAFIALYKVEPKRINIIKVPSKSVSRHGGKGFTSAGKKAIVYLHQGDKIEYV